MTATRDEALLRRILGEDEFAQHLEQAMLLDIPKLALQEPALFGAHYLGLDMQWFHSEWLEIARNKNRKFILVLAPADHGKSVQFSNVLPLMEICENRNIRIALASSTDDQASAHMRYVAGQLASNPKIRQDFGDFRTGSPKWAWENEIIVAGRDPDLPLKDATMLAGGVGAGWLGRRADLIILDDILDLKNTATEEQRRKVKSWVMEAVVNMLEPWGRLIMVGTVQHHADLYMEILESPEFEDWDPTTGKGWTKLVYRAITEDPETGERKTLWPSKWPLEALEERKATIGPVAFDKRYQNIAVDEDQLIFPRADIEACYDFEYAIGDWERNWYRILAVDPAIGVKSTSSLFVALVLGWDRETDERYLIDLVRGRYSQPRQEQIIYDLWEQYETHETVIEANAYQKGLEQSMRLMAPGMLVRGHYTGGNKVDPEVGVVQLCRPPILNHLLHIPRADKNSRVKTQPFIDEAAKFPAAPTTDTIMAWWFAEIRVKVGGKILTPSSRSLIKETARRARKKLGRQGFLRRRGGLR